jgi:hypothetical protein
MATIGHKFKKALLSYDALSQREILDNVQTEAMKRDETAFYTWVQQICFARINAPNDREFADNTLWNELIRHLESPTLRTSVLTM